MHKAAESAMSSRAVKITFGGMVIVVKPEIEIDFGIISGFLGRPRDGVVYKTYKYSKYNFRR